MKKTDLDKDIENYWNNMNISLEEKENMIKYREEDLKKTPSIIYWSRKPGKFVNKFTGFSVMDSVKFSVGGPVFEGNVREWYETLMETITDAGNYLERRTEKKPDEIIVGPDVLTILEHLVGFKSAPNDGSHYLPKEGFVATLNNRFKVIFDKKQNPTEILIKCENENNTITVKVLDLGLI